MISLEVFAALTESVPYRAKGMFYSEVFLFLEACARAAVDLIIESGVKNGMSTSLLSAAWNGELISVDKDASAFRGPHRFVAGDALDVVPRLLEEHAGRKVGILIDGPKGQVAERLMLHVWPLEEVRVVAIHDVPATRDCTRHSHDPEFRRTVGRVLDAYVDPDYLRKYPDGPGLAVWEKSA